MTYKVWVCSRAELMKIQALPLAFRRNSHGVETIQQQDEAVRHRQDEAEQRRDTGELRQPLAGSISRSRKLPEPGNR